MNGARHLHLVRAASEPGTALQKNRTGNFVRSRIARGLIIAFGVAAGVYCLAGMWNIGKVIVPAASERVGGWVDRNIGPLLTLPPQRTLP